MIEDRFLPSKDAGCWGTEPSPKSWLPNNFVLAHAPSPTINHTWAFSLYKFLPRNKYHGKNIKLSLSYKVKIRLFLLTCSGLRCCWESFTCLFYRKKTHTRCHMGRSTREIQFETSPNTIPASSILWLTNFRPKRFLSIVVDLSSFFPLWIIKSICEPTKTCNWPRECQEPSKREDSLCFEQGICWFHLIRSWWLCILHENRLWTAISSFPPPYQQQLSYPKNLNRNEDDRRLPGEMVRARPVREGGCTSQYLLSFCTAAGKKMVSKSYI